MGPITHKRKKDGIKVHVKRFEGNILVVYNKRGKVLGAYGPQQQFPIKKFYERYESLKAGNTKRGG